MRQHKRGDWRGWRGDGRDCLGDDCGEVKDCDRANGATVGPDFGPGKSVFTGVLTGVCAM